MSLIRKKKNGFVRESIQFSVLFIRSNFLLPLFQADGKPDPKMYFWDVELDTVQYFNFETGRGEQDDYAAPSGAEGEMDTNDAER